MKARWSGLELAPRGVRECQCPLCFEVFSGETTFMWHRLGQKASPGKRSAMHLLGECRDPRSKGMTLSDRGVWQGPRRAA